MSFHDKSHSRFEVRRLIAGVFDGQRWLRLRLPVCGCRGWSRWARGVGARPALLPEPGRGRVSGHCLPVRPCRGSFVDVAS